MRVTKKILEVELKNFLLAVALYIGIDPDEVIVNDCEDAGYVEVSKSEVDFEEYCKFQNLSY